MKDYLPLARIGARLHYVDDYRYMPGLAICNRELPLSANLRAQPSDGYELCKVCESRDYPTEAEWYQHHTCTDCGDYMFDESFCPIRPRTWELACPGYSSGVGVGSSRLCVGCLENRLDRELVSEDFLKGTEPEPFQSERLQARIRGVLLYS